MFSKACEYGIRATIYIAGQSKKDRRVSLKDIASEIDSPVAFTAKILQLLARNNIIDSVKGPAGGFEISEVGRKSINLGHIVSAIDGDNIYTGCGLGLRECSALHPCPVHNKFKKIRDELRNMLETTTVEELSTQQTKGLTFLRT